MFYIGDDADDGDDDITNMTTRTIRYNDDDDDDSIYRIWQPERFDIYIIIWLQEAVYKEISI